MIKINNKVLNQFDKEDQSINEGIAIDARLGFNPPAALSAKDEIIKLREKKETPEGKLDKI